MADEKKEAALAKSESNASGLWSAHHGQDLAYNQGWRLAETLAKSGLLPKALQGKPEDVFVILLHGQDFGLTATQALRSMHVIEGRPAMSAELIIGLVKRRPDRCKYFTLVESTDKIATYETQEVGAPTPTRLSYTIEQAQAAGLAGKDNWRKHPAAMLRARAGKGLAVAVYADITAGLLEEDEAEEMKAAPRSRDDLLARVTPPMGAAASDVVGVRPNGAPVFLAAKTVPMSVETTPPGQGAPRTLAVIDVAPGETEEQAEKRLTGEPSPEDKLDAYLRECEQSPEAFAIKRYNEMARACGETIPATFDARRRAIQAKAQAGGGK